MAGYLRDISVTQMHFPGYSIPGFVDEWEVLTINGIYIQYRTKGVDKWLKGS
jgi:hypothetical protein